MVCTEWYHYVYQKQLHTKLHTLKKKNLLSIYLTAPGLSCITCDLALWPGPPALGAWSLTHRITREGPCGWTVLSTCFLTIKFVELISLISSSFGSLSTEFEKSISLISFQLLSIPLSPMWQCSCWYNTQELGGSPVHSTKGSFTDLFKKFHLCFWLPLGWLRESMNYSSDLFKEPSDS